MPNVIEDKDVFAYVDHTLLAPTASWDDIRQLCDDGISFATASVCLPPCFVRQAKDYLRAQGSPLPVCTVIAFPNGYATSAAKVFEAQDALHNGADEIDMVVNIGALKAGRDGFVLDEIKAVKRACGTHVLKVIVETCLLTEEEKIRACRIVTDSGADFIKTSTGFSSGGATAADIGLFAAHVGPGVRIKAAGGIASFADAKQFLSLGASRLGTSRIVRLAKKGGY